MTRIGSIRAASTVYGGMEIIPSTGALYTGFDFWPPDAQMFLTSGGDTLPTSVGTFNFGQGEGLFATRVDEGGRGGGNNGSQTNVSSHFSIHID